LRTASRIGFDASGTSSSAGIERRDIVNSFSGCANREWFG
jgi:hypothetical protein